MMLAGHGGTMVHRWLGVALGFLLLVARPAAADPQAAGEPRRAPAKAKVEERATATTTPMPSFASLFRDLGSDIKQLPPLKTATILGVGGAASLFVHSEDRSLSERANASNRFDNAFDSGAVVGDGLFTFGTALITYAAGRATDHPAVARLGSDLFRAQVFSAAITNGLKFTVRRARPDGGRNGFPSGHTSAIFATASVLHRRYGWKAGVPAYLLASYTGVSRLSENKHYPSDVLFGAAVGLAAGHAIHLSSGSREFVVTPIASPDGRGAGIGFTYVSPHR
jgi:membrane-associated phospholipid phosphatase